VKRTRALLGLLAVLALVAAACGDDDDATTGGTATTAAPGTTGDAGDCAVEDLPLHEPGVLTVATGDPVFPPWMVDDDPTNGEGFESALVYALAEEMGFTADQVEWTRTDFDQAINPGDKPYDFNIQQYTITAQRDEVVDFSDGYYSVEQAIVAAADADITSATSLADLQGAKLGASIATTSLDYIDEVIQPDQPAAVYDDYVAVKSALEAGQIDGFVADLPTAYYITAVEIPEASIVGVLPTVGDEEQLGMLFEEGSPLVPCVNRALQALKDDGTLAALEEEWLNQGGDIPTLSA
jgi:polar amino acid transport system substrate-binding protein